MVTVPLPLASATETALAFDGPAPRWHGECQRNPKPAEIRQIHDQRCRARLRLPGGDLSGGVRAPRAQDGASHHALPPAYVEARSWARGRCAREHAAHDDGSMRRLSGFCIGVTHQRRMVHGGALEPRRSAMIENQRNPSAAEMLVVSTSHRDCRTRASAGAAACTGARGCRRGGSLGGYSRPMQLA